jgi:hypothetical protein
LSAYFRLANSLDSLTSAALVNPEILGQVTTLVNTWNTIFEVAAEKLELATNRKISEEKINEHSLEFFL